jgi:hypothetical protein
MADANPTGQGTAKCLTTRDEDEREETAVLCQVLEHHPAALTQDELTREMTGGGSTAICDADPVERAVRDLAAAGLLHLPGEDEMVRPTRAAIRYCELTGGAI